MAGLLSPQALNTRKILVDSSCLFERQRTKEDIAITMQRMKNILIVGNCQVGFIADYLRQHPNQYYVDFVQIYPKDIEDLRKGGMSILTLIDAGFLDRCDTIVVQHHTLRYIEEIIGNRSINTLQLPMLVFNGFHPDMVYIYVAQEILRHSPTGNCHSALAYFGWRNGLRLDDTEELFSGPVFESLGYLKMFDTSVAHLEQVFTPLNLSFQELSESLRGSGCWMHTVNHPYTAVLSALCNQVFSIENCDISKMEDPLESEVKWGVYPEIASYLNATGKAHVTGGYEFAQSSAHLKVSTDRVVFGLREFLEKSYSAYDTFKKLEVGINCPRLETNPFLTLRKTILPSRNRVSFASGADLPENSVHGQRKNPYHGLPDHHFWRRAVARMPLCDVDPVVCNTTKFKPTDRIATAGSCFAQHIAKRLEAGGMIYYVAERGYELETDERKRRNYGVFSARYGNIYTVRQLSQLFERAYGYLTPLENFWNRPDGGFVDPFRPEIEPDGFKSEEEVAVSRTLHLKSVRELFENLEVFIFTLGLTEGWRNRFDGCVYPLSPGVAAGSMDPEKHEFVNFGVNEIIGDFERFIGNLKLVNPKARIVLTVSPVPLMATYVNQHVLVANTYSKAVLRVVADEICRNHDHCEYFPSYEIITGCQTRGAFFGDDLRSVKQEGVDQVMKIFMKHYTYLVPGKEPGAKALNVAVSVDLKNDLTSRDDDESARIEELECLADVLCDEELLDKEDQRPQSSIVRAGQPSR